MPSRVPVQVLSGNCPIDDLPDLLDLSELAEGMERLWMKSVARLDEGIVAEYAATLVKQADGSLKLINEISGDSTNVVPDWATTEPGTFIGTFQTHPRTDEFLPMPFSDTDFVSAIQLREKLSLLYSDDVVCALVRTAATVDYINIYEIKNEFLSFVMTPDMEARFLPNAVWAANKWLARKYGFGLYMGTPNELFREV